MVSVDYTHRITCDSEFLDWLSKQPKKESLLSQLIHIKSSSERYKGLHNLILNSEVRKCTPALKLNAKYLGASFKPFEDPDFLQSHKDSITRNIIFAINLAWEKPNKCYIFTTPEKEKSYRDNPHYNGVKSVDIASGEKCIGIITEFFQAFSIARDAVRASIVG